MPAEIRLLAAIAGSAYTDAARRLADPAGRLALLRCSGDVRGAGARRPRPIPAILSRWLPVRHSGTIGLGSDVPRPGRAARGVPCRSGGGPRRLPGHPTRDAFVVTGLDALRRQLSDRLEANTLFARERSDAASATSVAQVDAATLPAPPVVTSRYA